MKRFLRISPISINTKVDSFQFSDELWIRRVPEWFWASGYDQNLGWFQKDDLSSRSHALVTFYENEYYDILGSRMDQEKVNILDEEKLEDQKKLLLAMKIAQNSRLQFDTSYIFLANNGDHEEVQMSSSPKFLHVEGEKFIEFKHESFEQTKTIYENVQKAFKTKTISTPLSFYWSSFLAGTLEVKFCLFWFALEGIFGPRNPGETIFQIAQRISRFLRKTKEERLALNKILKVSYGLRSAIAHGKSFSFSAKETELYFRTEEILQDGIKKIWTFKDWENNFSGERRDNFFIESCFE